jgi:hypothetical protein
MKNSLLLHGELDSTYLVIGLEGRDKPKKEFVK